MGWNLPEQPASRRDHDVNFLDRGRCRRESLQQHIHAAAIGRSRALAATVLQCRVHLLQAGHRDPQPVKQLLMGGQRDHRKHQAGQRRGSGADDDVEVAPDGNLRLLLLVSAGEILNPVANLGIVGFFVCEGLKGKGII